MARKSPINERLPANISYDEMKMALPKLERRIDELKSFNIQTLLSSCNAEILNQKRVQKQLAKIIVEVGKD